MVRSHILLFVVGIAVLLGPAAADASQGDGAAASGSKLPFKLKQFDSYAIEIAAVALCVAILINMVRGRRTNERLAIRYVAELVRSGGAVERQFADAQSQVVIEGPDVFKFYASGRRYCQGALLTFRMAKRQDLVTLAINPATRDMLDIEVAMNEASMPQTVLFVGTHSAARTVAKEHEDVDKMAKLLAPTRDRLAAWPANDLVVHAEQAGVFYEVISPAVMDAFFGPAAWPEVAPFFRYMHASSDYRVPGEARRRAAVRISLALPGCGTPETLDKFIMLACLLVDGLGSCKLTPEQAKRATEARHKVETTRAEAAEEAAKRLEERRAAKEAEERERLSKLPPGQREKERAKRDKMLRERRIRQMTKKF